MAQCVFLVYLKKKKRIAVKIQNTTFSFFSHNVAKDIYTIWIATLIPIPTCFANKTVEYSDLIENRYLS